MVQFGELVSGVGTITDSVENLFYCCLDICSPTWLVIGEYVDVGIVIIIYIPTMFGDPSLFVSDWMQ